MYSVAQSCPALCDPMNYIACQVPLSMGFSRQEYQNRLPFPSPGNLPEPGVKPKSLVSPALARRFFTIELPGKQMHFITLSEFSSIPRLLTVFYHETVLSFVECFFCNLVMIMLFWFLILLLDMFYYVN